MCGRYGIEEEYVQLALYYQAALQAEDPGARYNISPRSKVSILALRDDALTLASARWGIPHWAKDLSIGDKLINARAETTSPNGVMERLYNRMPVILDEGAIEAWLEPDKDSAVFQSMLVPCPDELLEAYPVSTAVNSPKNQGLELIAPV